MPADDTGHAARLGDGAARYMPADDTGVAALMVAVPASQRSVAASRRGQYIPWSRHISAVAALCPNVNVRDVVL